MKKRYFDNNGNEFINVESEETYEIDREALFNNTAPRCPVVFIVDTSGSMGFKRCYNGISSPIDEVNKGIKGLIEFIKNDYEASKKVELAVIEFNNDTRLISDFAPIDAKEAPVLKAHGRTFMVPAIKLAYQMITNRKKELRESGREVFRAIVFLLSDGGPADNKEEFAELKATIRHATQERHLTFYALKIGTEKSEHNEHKHMELLQGFDTEVPASTLATDDFAKFFKWVSNSVQSYSRSNPQGGSSFNETAIPWQKM